MWRRSLQPSCWRGMRCAGPLPGIDSLEEAHRLALAVLGATEDELDAEGRIVPESHLRSLLGD